ncbi:hypothetical protein FLJU110815_05100 [Flavobacterium jumunjinense]
MGNKTYMANTLETRFHLDMDAEIEDEKDFNELLRNVESISYTYNESILTFNEKQPLLDHTTTLKEYDLELNGLESNEIENINYSYKKDSVTVQMSIVSFLPEYQKEERIKTYKQDRLVIDHDFNTLFFFCQNLHKWNHQYIEVEFRRQFSVRSGMKKLLKLGKKTIRQFEKDIEVNRIVLVRNENIEDIIKEEDAEDYLDIEFEFNVDNDGNIVRLTAFDEFSDTIDFDWYKNEKCTTDIIKLLLTKIKKN